MAATAKPILDELRALLAEARKPGRKRSPPPQHYTCALCERG